MLEVLLDLVLVARVGVDDVPAEHDLAAVQCRRSEDCVDELAERPVGEAEVGAGDDHEADHDGRGLSDLAAVGPLDALELLPAVAEEGDDPVAAAALAPAGGAVAFGAGGDRRGRGGAVGALDGVLGLRGVVAVVLDLVR